MSARIEQKDRLRAIFLFGVVLSSWKKAGKNLL